MTIHKDWRIMDPAEKVAAIKRVYEPGYSASQIASMIAGACRNGICSLYHRKPAELADCPLLQRRAGGRPRSSTPRAPRIVRTSAIKAALAPRRKSEPKPPREPEPQIVRPDMRMVVLMDLGRDECKWPIEGYGAATLFCGCATHEPGKPYCAFHRRASVQQ